MKAASELPPELKEYSANLRLIVETAFAHAEKAAMRGEVPVGATIFDRKFEIVAAAHNRTLTDCDPSAHAEIVALRAAAAKVGNHRLTRHHMYVTLEPCAMCVGAILHARLDHVFYGADDPKSGACGSVIDVGASEELNHQTTFCGGLMRERSVEILQDFFRQRR